MGEGGGATVSIQLNRAPISGEDGWRSSVRFSAITGMKATAEGGDTIKQMKKKCRWEDRGEKWHGGCSDGHDLTVAISSY
ncbi:uncharacterized [Tachysurus ichikawai]